MKRHSILAAGALAAVLVLMPDSASAQVADTTKKDTSAARNAPAPVQSQNRPAGAISDSAIIAMLELSHSQQVAVAELAGQRAQSDRVKRFAETLKLEHGKAMQELQAFAQRMSAADQGMSSGVGRDSTPPARQDSVMAKPDSSPMTPDSARTGRDNNANPGQQDSMVAREEPSGQPDMTFDNMQGLTGHEFDHGFIRLQVKHHEAEIGRLRNDVIPMIKDSDLKALVQRELPSLGRHLTMARELEAHLKTTN